MKYFFLLFFLISCNSEDKFTGVDFEGKEKSCTPMKEGQMCTEVFTPADQFALDCKDKGHKAIQCGCHDWICIK